MKSLRKCLRGGERFTEMLESFIRPGALMIEERKEEEKKAEDISSVLEREGMKIDARWESQLRQDFSVADGYRPPKDADALIDLGASEEQALDILRFFFKDEEKDDNVKTYEIEERLLRSSLPVRLRSKVRAKLHPLREKLTKDALERVVSRAEREYERMRVEPNEAVGIVAAQSIGEPGTQMSLPGWEQILLMNSEDGEERLLVPKIGDFVDDCISKFGAIRIGDAEVCDLSGVKEAYVLSLDKDGKLRWKRIKSCIRHKFSGELLLIRTKSGREITATPFHSFVTKKDGEIIAVAGSTLKEGDKIPVLRCMPCAFDDRENDSEPHEDCVRKAERNDESSEMSGNRMRAAMKKILLSEEIGYALGKCLAESDASFDDFISFVLNANVEFLRGFLRGSFAVAHNDGECVELSMKTRDLRDIFSLLLARLGVFSLKRERAAVADEKTKKVAADKEYLVVIPRGEFERLERFLRFGGSDGVDCAEEDVYWDEIERIEAVKCEDSYVYDISVEGLETFTTFEGVITHNTMRTFHYAGVGALYVTMGLPRIIEIMDARKKPSTPTMKIKLERDYAYEREKAEEVAAEIEETRVKDVASVSVSMEERCVLLSLNEERLEERRLSRDEVFEKLKKMGVEMEVQDNLIKIYPKEESYYELLSLERRIANTLLKGIEGIKRVLVRKDEDGEYTLFTEGSALKKVMRVKGVDFTRTTTNNIIEIAEVLGIEAARNAIIEEILSTLEEQGLDVDPRHISLIADAMTMDGEVKQIGRHGLAGEKASVLSRAAFEVTVEHLLDAALRGERDELQGITENVIVGQPIRLGTGAVELVAKPFSAVNKAESAERQQKRSGGEAG